LSRRYRAPAGAGHKEACDHISAPAPADHVVAAGGELSRQRGPRIFAGASRVTENPLPKRCEGTEPGYIRAWLCGAALCSSSHENAPDSAPGLGAHVMVL
jgi:hypothetical protein